MPADQPPPRVPVEQVVREVLATDPTRIWSAVEVHRTIRQQRPVSATSVRQALARLRQAGAVESVLRRGPAGWRLRRTGEE